MTFFGVDPVRFPRSLRLFFRLSPFNQWGHGWLLRFESASTSSKMSEGRSLTGELAESRIVIACIAFRSAIVTIVDSSRLVAELSLSSAHTSIMKRCLWKMWIHLDVKGESMTSSFPWPRNPTPRHQKTKLDQTPLRPGLQDGVTAKLRWLRLVTTSLTSLAASVASSKKYSFEMRRAK